MVTGSYLTSVSIFCCVLCTTLSMSKSELHSVWVTDCLSVSVFPSVSCVSRCHYNCKLLYYMCIRIIYNIIYNELILYIICIYISLHEGHAAFSCVHKGHFVFCITLKCRINVSLQISQRQHPSPRKLQVTYTF